MNPGAPLLELNGLRKTLGGRVVLNDVSLSVFPGEVVVLLGPNGAGKTTLLGSACGRIAPDAGEVRVCGADPRRSASARRHLGLVPQSVALYAYLSVGENLDVFGRMMGVPRDSLSMRIAEALHWSGLDDRRRDRTDTLSGGMLRRLNIVASLLHEPELLMLDEPTVGVDVNARARIHELLGALKSRGLGILLTTHDLAQAALLADRVVFMVDGEMRLAGEPASLIESVFGDAKEIMIELDCAPDPGQQRALRTAGLSPGRGGESWTGRVAEGYDGVADWHHRLEALGLVALEIRVREPTLEGVFLNLTGESLDP